MPRKPKPAEPKPLVNPVRATPGFYWARSHKHRTMHDLIVYSSSERNLPWTVFNVILGTVEYPKDLSPDVVFGPAIPYPRLT